MSTTAVGQQLHKWQMGTLLRSSPSCRWPKRNQGKRVRIYGPRALVKHKQPDDWPSGIIPPPLLVSRASISCTTSSISGRLSGFASQHLRIIFANGLGQQRGMSGRKFCKHTRNGYIWRMCSAQIIERRNGNSIAGAYIEHRTNLVNHSRRDISKT